MKKTFKSGSWYLEFTSEDGARLNRLCYKDYDLITTEPSSFEAPASDYGEYEKRPVYGYDDCFPSVEESNFPGIDWVIPDHGEVCWLKWDYNETENTLTFFTKSKVLPIKFKREMIFLDSGIVWNFEVYNEVGKNITLSACYASSYEIR